MQKNILIRKRTTSLYDKKLNNSNSNYSTSLEQTRRNISIHLIQDYRKEKQLIAKQENIRQIKVKTIQSQKQLLAKQSNTLEQIKGFVIDFKEKNIPQNLDMVALQNQYISAMSKRSRLHRLFREKKIQNKIVEPPEIYSKIKIKPPEMPNIINISIKEVVNDEPEKQSSSIKENNFQEQSNQENLKVQNISSEKIFSSFAAESENNEDQNHTNQQKKEVDLGLLIKSKMNQILLLRLKEYQSKKQEIETDQKKIENRDQNSLEQFLLLQQQKEDMKEKKNEVLQEDMTRLGKLLAKKFNRQYQDDSPTKKMENPTSIFNFEQQQSGRAIAISLESFAIKEQQSSNAPFQIQVSLPLPEPNEDVNQNINVSAEDLLKTSQQINLKRSSQITTFSTLYNPPFCFVLAPFQIWQVKYRQLSLINQSAWVHFLTEDQNKISYSKQLVLKEQCFQLIEQEIGYKSIWPLIAREWVHQLNLEKLNDFLKKIQPQIDEFDKSQKSFINSNKKIIKQLTDNDKSSIEQIYLIFKKLSSNVFTIKRQINGQIYEVSHQLLISLLKRNQIIKRIIRQEREIKRYLSNEMDFEKSGFREISYVKHIQKNIRELNYHLLSLIDGKGFLLMNQSCKLSVYITNNFDQKKSETITNFGICLFNIYLQYKQSSNILANINSIPLDNLPIKGASEQNTLKWIVNLKNFLITFSVTLFSNIKIQPKQLQAYLLFTNKQQQCKLIKSLLLQGKISYDLQRDIQKFIQNNILIDYEAQMIILKNEKIQRLSNQNNFKLINTLNKGILYSVSLLENKRNQNQFYLKNNEFDKDELFKEYFWEVQKTIGTKVSKYSKNKIVQIIPYNPARIYKKYLNHFKMKMKINEQQTSFFLK